MYLVTYQKRNGTIFCRIRNTIPNCSDGKTTSMGWKILDTKYRYKDNFYSYTECKKLERRQYKRNHIAKFIKSFLEKNAITLILLAIIMFLMK